MSSASRAQAWDTSYQALRELLGQYGKHGSTPDADFLIAEENQGGEMHFVHVFRLRPLTSALVAEVMRWLEREYPGWTVLFGLAMSPPEDGPDQVEGLAVHAGLVDELWDRDALAVRFGPDFTWPQGADALPVYRHMPEDDVTAQEAAEDSAPDALALCYRKLDAVRKQLARVEEPCRTAIVVDVAWGIIGNGGLPYFFGMNFDDDPDYAVFTDAFRRVGLDEIASRFDRLVAMFPFSKPHTSPQQRIAFMDTEPADFLAAMTELEALIYSRGDIDGVLDAFLQAARNGQVS